MDQGLVEEKGVSGLSLPGEQYRSWSLKICVQFVVAQPPYLPPKYHLKYYLKIKTILRQHDSITVAQSVTRPRLPMLVFGLCK